MRWTWVLLGVSLTNGYMQRRLKLRRVAIPNSQALLLLGRELREAHLQVLLGGSSGLRSNNNSTPSAAAAVDPSLSSLIMNFHASDAAEEIPKSLSSSIEELTSKKTPPSRSWKMRYYLLNLPIFYFIFLLEVHICRSLHCLHSLDCNVH
ncbi:hypothetical protein SAY87_031319 [Trapa incisa]|uniref:Di19 C-terminal domain-containing protein n=1 Tax=Trapa incisa TaxID=236973 RepID=A0AAN7KPJ2_9MYRT|nr:hypothetical protein SAY87_031319 [Trapa incisa]